MLFKGTNTRKHDSDWSKDKKDDAVILILVSQTNPGTGPKAFQMPIPIPPTEKNMDLHDLHKKPIFHSKRQI